MLLLESGHAAVQSVVVKYVMTDMTKMMSHAAGSKVFAPVQTNFHGHFGNW